MPRQAPGGVRLAGERHDRGVVGTGVAGASTGHADGKMDEGMAHIDKPWGRAMGGTDDESVFYYRV